MAKKIIKPFMKDIYETSEEGRMYLEYNEKVGGEPIGLMVPDGYPKGVKEHGGVVAVYKECIEKGITWEELLGFENKSKDKNVVL